MSENKKDNLTKKIKKENSSYSCYIFEFHQGNIPQILWNSGPSIKNVDELMWYVVTTPAAQDSNLSNSPPSIFSSYFDSNYFVSFYMLIPDSEARGFTRTVSVCICGKKQIENTLRSNGIINEIAILFQKSVQDSLPSFKKEISEYVGSLKSTMKENPDFVSLLSSIELEIKPLMESLNIESDINQKAQSPEKFTKINNDLRDVKNLFNFDALVKGLEDILDKCNKNMSILCKIMKYGQYNEDRPYFDFGNIPGSDFPNFAKQVFEYNSKIYSQKSKLDVLIKSKIFYHIIYSLLSGFPLIIESKDNFDDAIILGKKFSLFIPFFQQSSIFIQSNTNNETDNQNDALKMSEVVLNNQISICRCLIRESIHGYASYLNIDKCFYEGSLCPQQSFIFSNFDFSDLTKEASILLLSFTRLKDLGNRYVQLIQKIIEQNTEYMRDMKKFLYNLGYNEADSPILQNWIYSASKEFDFSVVVFPQIPVVPEGILVYYEEEDLLSRSKQE